MGDPGEINRRSGRLRGLSIALVSVLVFGSLWATVSLISDPLGILGLVIARAVNVFS